VGGSASTSAAYDVFPTLQAIAPGVGDVDTEIALAALGLAAEPSRNVARFSPDVPAPFVSPARSASRREPVSGLVSLEVNGHKARESLPLTVPAVVPACGSLLSACACDVHPR